jgi:hypothetical protein
VLVVYFQKYQKCFPVGKGDWSMRPNISLPSSTEIYDSSTHEMRSAYEMSIGKPEGKRPLGTPRSRWEDNIRMDLKRSRVGSCGLDSSRD